MGRDFGGMYGGAIPRDYIVFAPNSNLTTIGREAFDTCSCIETMVIPDGVTTIGEKAFYDCSMLKKIYIPKSVTSIGLKAFGHEPQWIDTDVWLNYINKIKVYYEGNEDEWNAITKASQIFCDEEEYWSEEYGHHTVLFNQTPEDMNS